MLANGWPGLHTLAGAAPRGARSLRADTVGWNASPLEVESVAYLAKHMADVEPSDIRKWTSVIEQVQGINLAQGNCFIEPAPYFDDLVAATLDAINRGRTATGYNTYAHASGVPALREAIAKKVREFNGFVSDPDVADGDITVTAGATGGLNCVLNALMDPGDEVILFEPYYSYHLQAIMMQSGTPQFAALRAPSWGIDLVQLGALVTPRTRAIVVNTPHNPTGKVFTRAELEAIGRLCVERDIYLISDEVYEFVTFDDERHVSPASIEEIASHVVTISSFSKTLAITGWRLGYVIAPRPVARRVRIANEMNYICAPTPLQQGIAAIVCEWQRFLPLKHHYATKRTALCETLVSLGLVPSVPKGAYYVLTDCSSLGLVDDVAINRHLIQRYRIAGVPGAAFFNRSPSSQHIRFCFAVTDAELASLPSRRVSTLSELPLLPLQRPRLC